jgi:hypothetical protein
LGLDGVFPIAINSTSARAACLWHIKSAPFIRFTGTRFRLELRGYPETTLGKTVYLLDS